MRLAREEQERALRPIRSNEGVLSWYRETLQELLQRMTAEILRKLRAHYRPALRRMALDDDPVVTLRKAMGLWGRRWQKRFEQLSAEIARSFAGRNQRHTDAAIRRRMREAGFTVRFKATERQVSAYRAIVAENVGLIRSIPQQYLREVQGAVWRAVMRGGSMSELSIEIRKRHGISYRRAAFIARDQVAKAKSVLENVRRAEIGITEAIWQHSHAGRVPRPTHVKMHGQRYELAKGMWDCAVQQWIQPGFLPRCRCSSRSIIPQRLQRR